MVVGWEEDVKENAKTESGRRVLKHMPTVVYVQFYKANGERESWHVDGVGDKGVYPITSTKKEWYLDKGRDYPSLAIRREQLPLAPAFAITAHASQGQTLQNGAIVDLSQTGSGNPLTAYVGITRVPSLDKLIIYRAFDAAPFQKGNTRGRELLMQSLRKEEPINWDEVMEQIMPRRRCGGCDFAKYKQDFTTAHWERTSIKPVCKDCIAANKLAGFPLQCTMCELWKSEVAFSIANKNYRNTNMRVCLQCVETRLCAGPCGKRLPEENFTDNQWWRARRENLQGKCRDCMRMHTCQECYQKVLQENFSKWLAENGDKHHSVCNRCLETRGPKRKTGCWLCDDCKNQKSKETGFTKWKSLHTVSFAKRKHICDECIERRQKRDEGRKRARKRETSTSETVANQQSSGQKTNMEEITPQQTKTSTVPTERAKKKQKQTCMV